MLLHVLSERFPYVYIHLKVNLKSGTSLRHTLQPLTKSSTHNATVSLASGCRLKPELDVMGFTLLH